MVKFTVKSSGPSPFSFTLPFNTSSTVFKFNKKPSCIEKYEYGPFIIVLLGYILIVTGIILVNFPDFYNSLLINQGIFRRNT